jgi:hypothetical protein
MAYWGFDSASSVSSSTLACLASSGAPTDEIKFILRYLDTVVPKHDGLTTAEVDLIHGQGIALGLIHGNIQHVQPLTFTDGVNNAKGASTAAEALGVPTYVALYADLGASYSSDVSAAFIEGYAYEMTLNTPYHPGFYGPFDDGSSLATQFATAFNDSTYGTYVQGSLVWNNQPNGGEAGCTIIADAPAYAPTAPPGTTYGTPPVWQYAIKCGCDIDEDLSTIPPTSDRWWQP